MTRSRHTLLLATAAAVALVTTAGAVCAASPNGRNEARLVVAAQRDAKNGVVAFPVTIDLSNVQLDGRAAVLGAYVVSIRFDKEKVEFVNAVGGTDSHFAEAPAFTPAEKANGLGLVKLVGDQADSVGPTGSIHVATATFREKVPGGASTVKVSVDSLASALQKDASGRFLTDLAIRVAKDAD
jgi:hypothetical protein